MKILTSEMIDIDQDIVGHARSSIRLMPEGMTPSLKEWNNVVAVPGLTGLYDEEGVRIDQSSILWVYDHELVHPADRLKFAASIQPINPPDLNLDQIRSRYGALEIEDAPTLFLGAYNRHYGHFVTDYSSRLWAGQLYGGGMRRLFLPAPGAQKFRNRSYIDHMLRASGAWGDASADLRRPILFRRIIVPEPSLQVRHVMYRNADAVHLGVARSLFDGGPTDFTGKQVYLSRSKLAERLRDVSGEAALDDLFRSLGFLTVYPERLTFEEQVALFNSASVIVGLSGSAFHTGMFSLPDYTGHLIIISGNEALNTRFVLQNAIKPYHATFVGGYNFSKGDAGGRPELRPDIDRLRTNLALAGVA